MSAGSWAMCLIPVQAGGSGGRLSRMSRISDKSEVCIFGELALMVVGVVRSPKRGSGVMVGGSHALRAVSVVMLSSCISPPWTS